MITLRHQDDWIAVYKDGELVEEGHSCDLQRGLRALGIAFDDVDMEALGIDENGNMPDGSDAYPVRLPK